MSQPEGPGLPDDEQTDDERAERAASHEARQGTWLLFDLDTDLEEALALIKEAAAGARQED